MNKSVIINSNDNKQKIDFNQTYSFDSFVPAASNNQTDRPFVHLHQELNNLLSIISSLRQKIDQESDEISKIRQFLIKLNGAAHNNSDIMKKTRLASNDNLLDNDAICSMLLKHNELLKEQLRFFKELPSSTDQSITAANLKQKIASLQKDIQEEKDKVIYYASHDFTDEKNKVRTKINYLKKERDDLEEFIHQEIKFEREQDENIINELNDSVKILTNDIESTKERLKQQKSSQFVSDYTNISQRIRLAKQKIAKFNNDIIYYRSENEKLNSSITLSQESIERLERERNLLQQLLTTAKSSRV